MPSPRVVLDSYPLYPALASIIVDSNGHLIFTLADGSTIDAGDVGQAGTAGEDAWSPVLAVATSSAAKVLQVTDWTGGNGLKPAIGVYLSASGFTNDITQAIDIRPFGVPNVQSGTTYTIQTTDREAFIRHNNVLSSTYTLPNNLPDGFLCTVRQVGVGQTTFIAGAGATLVSYAGYTKTAGQYASVALEVISNTSGVNAVWALDGAGA